MKMTLNTAFAYVYDKNTQASTVLLHNKKHTLWKHHWAWPTPFTCAVTGLNYYADGSCYTCDELPDVLISGEGIARLRTQAFSFLR